MANHKWNCFEGKRCFMFLKHPRLEIFDDCFPGKNEMSDVDGWIERRGRILNMECVSRSEIETGQYIALASFVGNTWKQQALVYVCRNVQTMAIVEFAWVDDQSIKGWQTPRWQRGNLDDLRAEIRRWADWAWNAPDGLFFDRHARIGG